MSARPSPCRAWVERYLELVNSRRFEEIASLFADDCTYLNPLAKRALHGPEEISGFYTGFIGQLTPTPRAGFLVEDGARCAFELELPIDGSTTEYRLAGVDTFVLDEHGRATRFAVFPFGSLESWD